jgi:hypothetical protein
MPLRKQLPTSLRYSSKSRLRPLWRPAFWGAAIFLPVVGLVTWQYWVDPESIASLLQKPDIDRSPLLSEEFKQSRGAAAPVAPDKETEASNTKELSQDHLEQKQATLSSDTQPTPLTVTDKPAAPPQNVVETPLLLQAKNLLQPSPLTPNYINQNQSGVPNSPVQRPLSQSAAANPVGTTAPQAPLTNALGQSLPSYAKPSQNSPPTTQASAGTGYTPSAATNNTPPPNSYTHPVQPQSVQPQSVIRVLPYSALLAPR